MQTKSNSAVLEREGLAVQEMALVSGLSAHTLRYYERIGLLMPIPRDSSSGHRRYSSDSIGVLNTLSCLRATGMSIDDMRRYLQLRKRGDVVAGEQKRLFAAHAAALARELEMMHARMEYVAGKVAYWAAVDAGDLGLAEEIAVVNQYRGDQLKTKKDE